MNGEVDVEDMGEVRVPRSLSLRQSVGLLFLIYFGVTSGLFFLVEKGMAEQSTPGAGGPESGEEVFVTYGRIPQVSRIGERYALVFHNQGLRLSYSEDGVNWTQPVVIHRWEDPLGVGNQGFIFQRKNGDFLLVYSAPDPEKSDQLQLFSVTSDDGFAWSKPVVIPTAPLRIYQIYGISATESGERIVLAFSGDGFGIATVESRDAVHWEQPSRRRSLDTYGGISVMEKNGDIYIAYVDTSVVWVARWEGTQWNVTRATPRDLFSYLGTISMVGTANGVTVLSFDHLNSVYLCRSRDLVDWQEPTKVVDTGSSPSITPYGDDMLLLAYHRDNGIYMTFVDTAGWILHEVGE